MSISLPLYFSPLRFFFLTGPSEIWSQYKTKKKEEKKNSKAKVDGVKWAIFTLGHTSSHLPLVFDAHGSTVWPFDQWAKVRLLTFHFTFCDWLFVVLFSSSFSSTFNFSLFPYGRCCEKKMLKFGSFFPFDAGKERERKKRNQQKSWSKFTDH